MSGCFPKLKSFRGKVKVEYDSSNYATEADLRNATGVVDTSKFAQKVDVASLQSEIHKLDIDKLEKIPIAFNSLKSKVHKVDVDKLLPVPLNLRKLSDVVKNDVVKKDVYNAKIKDIEDKISITSFDFNTTLNAKIK